MAVKTIETKAIISAQDKTGATFSAVAQKLRGLEQTAASASRRMDSVARGMSAVGVARAERASFHDLVSRGMSSARVSAVAGPSFSARAGAVMTVASDRAIQTAAVAAATAAVATPAIRKIIESAARRGDERISQSLAGLGADEIGRISDAGAEITARHRSISRTEAEGAVRDLRTVVDSVETATRIADEVARLRIILRRTTPNASDEDLGRQIGEIVRAADQTGATASKERFGAFVSDYTKARNAFGDVMQPGQFREFIQGSRGAAAGWSREFLSGVVPSLLQTMGSEGGVALQSIHAALVGGQMEKKAKDQMQSLGLMDKSGRVVDVALAQSNPFRWVQDRLRPALEKHGVTGEGAQGELVDRLFSDRTARQAAKLLLLNRQQIERDAAASGKAKGLEGADEIERRDLRTATAALTAQFDNLGAALGQGLTPKVVNLANAISEKIGERARLAEKDPRENARTWIAGGLGAGVLGHLGLSALGGYFGGAGVGAGFGAMMGVTTAPMIAATAGMGAYKMYENWGKLNSMLDEGQAAMKAPAENIDRSPGAIAYRLAARGARPDLYMGSGAARSGLLNFGVGGPVGPMASPVAKLEGAANIEVKVEVAPTSDFLVRVSQQLEASGALRSADVGVSMPP